MNGGPMAARVILVFDLDDTLYLERDYARSGFDAVGRWLRDELSVEGFSQICEELLNSGARGDIFDKALECLGRERNPALIKRLVEIYRSHEPVISLTEDSARYMARRARDIPLALITDGPLETQSSKVRALGLEGVIDRIVYTGALGPGFGKPHPRAFEIVESWARPFGAPLAYVADNPLKDFVTPRARGWLTVQVERPRRVHEVSAPSNEYLPHGKISNLDELDPMLDELMEKC